MDNEIYNNLLEYYNESGPFYISKTSEIKIDWFQTYASFHKEFIFSAFLSKDIIDIKKLLKEIDGKDSKFPVSSPYYTILTKLKEWNNMYTIADSYFGF
jgi:hypothetical protein